MPRQPRPERSRHKPVLPTRNLLGLVLSLGLGLGHWHGALAQGFDLDGLRWERRPLLVFAPSPKTPLALALRDALGRADIGLFDRDMVVIEVYGDDAARADGASLPTGTAAHLRQRFAVAATDELVVLLGKDGGEKLRTDLPRSRCDLQPDRYHADAASRDEQPMTAAQRGRRDPLSGQGNRLMRAITPSRFTSQCRIAPPICRMSSPRMTQPTSPWR